MGNDGCGMHVFLACGMYVTCKMTYRKHLWIFHVEFGSVPFDATGAVHGLLLIWGYWVILVPRPWLLPVLYWKVEGAARTPNGTYLVPDTSKNDKAPSEDFCSKNQIGMRREERDCIIMCHIRSRKNINNKKISIWLWLALHQLP